MPRDAARGLCYLDEQEGDVPALYVEDDISMTCAGID